MIRRETGLVTNQNATASENMVTHTTTADRPCPNQASGTEANNPMTAITPIIAHLKIEVLVFCRRLIKELYVRTQLREGT